MSDLHLQTMSMEHKREYNIEVMEWKRMKAFTKLILSLWLLPAALPEAVSKSGFLAWILKRPASCDEPAQVLFFTYYYQKS